jgi:hypothetical protein
LYTWKNIEPSQDIWVMDLLFAQQQFII